MVLKVEAMTDAFESWIRAVVVDELEQPRHTRRIIAEPTTTAPTMENHWDAPVPASTPLDGSTLSQSAPPITENGPAVQPSACAHYWEVPAGMERDTTQATYYNRECKRGCGALRSFVVTPVPAAAPQRSIYPKPASSESAAPSNEASAPSPSSVWTKCPLPECTSVKACCWLECAANPTEDVSMEDAR